MSASMSKMLALTAAALFVGAWPKNRADIAKTPEPATKMKCFSANDCAGQSVCQGPR